MILYHTKEGKALTLGSERCSGRYTPYKSPQTQRPGLSSPSSPDLVLNNNSATSPCQLRPRPNTKLCEITNLNVLTAETHRPSISNYCLGITTIFNFVFLSGRMILSRLQSYITCEVKQKL